MYEILINLLIFCGIILLLAITVGVVQGIIVMIDVRRTTKKVTKKVEAVTSIIDIGALLLGGVDGAKKRMQNQLAPSKDNIVALIGGIKRGLQVLFKKDNGDSSDKGK
ncbi:hypothetical protein ACFL5U_01720 [Candidatus Margulisiibacteriota bacterium]